MLMVRRQVLAWISSFDISLMVLRKDALASCYYGGVQGFLSYAEDISLSFSQFESSLARVCNRTTLQILDKVALRA